MSSRRVVVTGIGAISSVGNSVDAMWESLVAGRSGIGPITKFDAADFKTRIAGEVKDLDVTQYMTEKEARRLDDFCIYAIAAGDADRAAELTTEHTIHAKESMMGRLKNHG